MGGLPAVLWWVPTAAVVVVAAVGLAAAIVLPWGPLQRRRWIIGVAIVGTLAIAGSAVQQARSRVELKRERSQLNEFAARLDAIARLLPGGPEPQATAGTVGAAIRALDERIRELERQIAELRSKFQRREIEPETAAKLAEHLRPFGRRRVVVSCAPDEVEAYGYANQFANLLRQAGWDAHGPEPTKIYGNAPGMGVELYVGAGQGPDTAQILIDALARFNIPYRSKIAPSSAIPDADTVELFVPKKP